MKSTGIVRRIDDLGRCVIPKEIRRNLNIDEGDPMEIFVDGDKIILRKYQPGCVFCGSLEIIEPTLFGKHICSKCANQIAVLPIGNIAQKSIVGGTK